MPPCCLCRVENFHFGPVTLICSQTRCSSTVWWQKWTIRGAQTGAVSSKARFCSEELPGPIQCPCAVPVGLTNFHFGPVTLICSQTRCSSTVQSQKWPIREAQTCAVSSKVCFCSQELPVPLQCPCAVPGGWKNFILVL